MLLFTTHLPCSMCGFLAYCCKQLYWCAITIQLKVWDTCMCIGSLTNFCLDRLQHCSVICAVIINYTYPWFTVWFDLWWQSCKTFNGVKYILINILSQLFSSLYFYMWFRYGFFLSCKHCIDIYINKKVKPLVLFHQVGLRISSPLNTPTPSHI